MKKLIFLTVVLLSITVQSQEFSYGVLLGTHAYKIPINGDLSSKGGLTAINIGAFGNKKINESFGVQLNVFFGKSVENGFNSDDTNLFTGKININKVNTQLLLKYDPNESYGDGFYFLVGPRLTFISMAETRGDGIDITDLYKPIYEQSENDWKNLMMFLMVRRNNFISFPKTERLAGLSTKKVRLADLRDKIIIDDNVVISMQTTFITHIDMTKSELNERFPAKSASIRIIH